MTIGVLRLFSAMITDAVQFQCMIHITATLTSDVSHRLPWYIDI